MPLCIGVIVLLATKKLTTIHPVNEPSAPIVKTDNQPWQAPGTVIADDEEPSSPPKQITLDTPPPVQQNYALIPVAQKHDAQVTPQKTVVIDNVEYPLRTYKTLFTPNDPFASQWWVSNTNLTQTWDIPEGTRPTTIAVIDTGFGLKHEEFSNRIYVNKAETGVATFEGRSLLNCTDRGLTLNTACNLVDDNHDGIVDNETGPTTYQNPSRLNCTDQLKPLMKDCNRLDDDGNGYIDDINGWDFVNGDNSAQAGELNPSGTGTAHGTMVTGVAAASGNNGKGIAGIDWNTKILPIQALDDDSYGDTQSVGRAIFYAVQQGADVINISLGSDAPDPYVQKAIQAATAAGIIVVAAAGNGGCDCMVYPANYPEVVAVGALNNNNQLASFSSWGKNLDILAPGTDITTTSWRAANPTNAYATGVNGTSFSAPIVSGLFSRLRSSQPNATPLQLIAALTENTNRLSLSVSSPHDDHLGFGTLDALKATQRTIDSFSPLILYSFSPISQGKYINPTKPADKIGSFLTHQCPDNIIPGTPIYELIKGGDDFFSISSAEVDIATTQGYSANIFSYACLQQIQDSPGLVRTIDMFSEFKNIYRKLR